MSSNICSRCGTERIVVRVWTEKLEGSTIVNKETRCPNKDCQKIVDEINKRASDKYAKMQQISRNRAHMRKAASDARRAEKVAA